MVHKILAIFIRKITNAAARLRFKLRKLEDLVIRECVLL
jgi:hypothetical protein